MQIVFRYFGLLRRFGQRFGPYLMVEMLLPGGTLLALLLFLYRRRKRDIQRGVQGVVLAVTVKLASVFEQCVLVPVPAKRQSACRNGVPPIDYRAQGSR